MAQRKTSPVFNKGSLSLNKVVGVRIDNGNKFIDAPVKKPIVLPETSKSMKDVANTTSDGYKK